MGGTMGYVTHIVEGITNLYAHKLISRQEAERQLDFADPLNQPGGAITLGKDDEWEAIEYQYEKKKKGKTRDNLNEEMMKLIPIGVCIRCQTLMYLGMTNCSKCGAPVGESIDLEELQERVQELLKPQMEIVYKESPHRGIMPMVLGSSDEYVDMCYSTSSAPSCELIFGSTSEAY